MEQFFQDFTVNLQSLITELNIYHPTPSTQKFLSTLDKLNIPMVIARYNKIGNKYKKEIENKDENLFINSGFNAISEINFSELWQYLSNEQKDRIWTYLQVLLIASNFIMDYSRNTQPTVETELSTNTLTKPVEQPKNPEKSKKLNFNPYSGIGSTENEFSMDDLMKGPKELPGEKKEEGSSITDGLSSMLNMGKLFDMNALADELRNINVDEIEKATSNIKDLLGSNVDKATTDMISDMLTDITDELKKVPDNDNTGNTKSNPLEKIMKIAENVAGKMAPKMKDKNIDVNKLWQSTQNLASQYGDNSGNNGNTDNPLNGFNPMSMLSNLMGQQSKMKENMEGKNEEERAAEYQKMIESSGLGSMMNNLMGGQNGGGFNLQNMMSMIPKMMSQMGNLTKSQQMNNNQNNQSSQSSPTKERLQKKLNEKRNKNN